MAALWGVAAGLTIRIFILAVIKTINLISGCVMHKELAAVHRVMNKLTGIALFILPLTLTIIDLKYSGAFVSAVATFAAVQEGHYIRSGKCDNPRDNLKERSDRWTEKM